MAEWIVRPIGEVCTVKPPKAEAKARLAGHDPVSFAPMEDLGIGVKYLEPKHTRRLDEVSGSYTYFADGDVLLAKITPCFENGKLGIARGLVNGIGFGSSEYFVLRPNPVLDAEFLYYYLARPSFLDEGARHMSGAVGHKRVNKEFLEEYPIPLAPLPEQRRIVAILDEAFEGIATAKANTHRNLQNSQELLSKYLEGVFSAWGASWRMERLDALTLLARGHNPPKSKFSREPGPGYVRFYQIRDGSSDEHAVYVPDTPQLHKMKSDDIMMVAYRHVGRVFRGVEGAFNVALCKIGNARRDLLHDDYLFHVLTSRHVKGELLKRSERSLIPSMSIEHLRELQIPLPPLAEQQKIVDEIATMSEECGRLESIQREKVAAYDELKMALLHQAFTGALIPKNAERHIAEFA